MGTKDGYWSLSGVVVGTFRNKKMPLQMEGVILEKEGQQLAGSSEELETRTVRALRVGRGHPRYQRPEVTWTGNLENTFATIQVAQKGCPHLSSADLT